MKRFVILSLLFAIGLSTAWGQATSACPGFHNPLNFNSTPGGAGSWSARVGDRVGNSAQGGSTGSSVLSTCSRANKTPIKGNINITSSTYYSGYCTHRCGSCSQCSSNGVFDGHDHRFQIYGSSDAGLDWYTVNAAGQGMQRIPPGHSSSIRLGDMMATGSAVYDINNNGNDKGAEALFYTMQVNTQNSLLFIDYAIVACRYNHTAYDAGEFTIRVCGKNATTGQWNNFPLTDSLWFNVPAPAITGSLPEPWVEGHPGGAAGATTCGYCYKPWTRVAISLIDYIYDSVRVEMYTSDCLYNVDPIYAYIAGSCQPMAITTSGCPGGESDAVDTLRAPEGLLTYTWYVSSTGYSGNTSNTEAMNDLPFRQVQATSTNPMYVSRLNDFIVTDGVNRGDTVGTTTYKCVMTSAMDPAKPFQSVTYATVSNTKPIINANFTVNCDSTVTFEGLGVVPYQGSNAPHLVDSISSWTVYDGSDDETPVIGTVYGRIATFKFSDMNTHAVKLTMYTEDSTCYTAKVFLVNPIMPPDNRITIDKRTLCVGEAATITDVTENIVSRRWEFEHDTIDSRAPGNSMTNTRMITKSFTEFENPFMLITSNEVGCIDTLYDTIYFFHDPEIHYSNDTIICNGHESHVRATTPVPNCTFSWYRHKDQPGEQPICEGNTLYVRPTQPRTKYYLKIVAQAGCVAWDSVYLSLISTNITASPSHGKHCPGDSVTLTGHGALWYHWTSTPEDPDLARQEDSVSITVSPNVDTRYYMVGYAADSCDVAAISSLVKVVPLPIIDLSYTPGYIDSETPVVNFTDLSENRDYTQWLFGDGAVASGETVTHYFDIYMPNSNVITMKTFNELGCYADSTFTLRIDTFGFYRPNVFTPNKPENNTFSIVCPSDMDAFHIAIFNRQGQMVFTSDDQHFQWDGTHNGRPMPQGAYAYVITYTRVGSISTYRLKGTVTLLR